MTCPHDNRACAAPRCAVCPLVELSEDDALAALFTVAALTGGHVNHLWMMPHLSKPVADAYHFGFAVISPVTWIWQEPLFVWQRASRLYGRVMIHEISTGIYPGGRVDRGLGAIRPKTAPGAGANTARGGDQAPTD